MDDEPDNPDANTYYFYDSQGHMYVDMTAIRERGRLEIVPLGGGEVEIGISSVRVDKHNPVVNISITKETDERLDEWYPDPDPSGPADAPEAVAEVLATLVMEGTIDRKDLYVLPNMVGKEVADMVYDRVD